MSTKRLDFDGAGHPRLTHYMFRYPARFHPPVARALIARFSNPGDTILDPFCGSGSVQIEAAVMGRSAVGLDVDPVAVFISEVRSRRYDIVALKASSQKFLERLTRYERTNDEYEKLKFRDISLNAYNRQIREENLRVPGIPNIFHWFRKYVLLDLARIKKEIESINAPATHKKFLLLNLVSILRNCSNADPVPVSGLEVTSHMKKRDKDGRVVRPLKSMASKISRSVDAVKEFQQQIDGDVKIATFQRDSTKAYGIRTKPNLIITSPPYLSAVDYYRRHTLEMYWLDIVETQDDRLKLLPHYIGRTQIARSKVDLRDGCTLKPIADRWESRIRKLDPKRADAFRHYSISMEKAFQSMSLMLAHKSQAIVVVGHSQWNGREIPTSRLLEECAAPHFEVSERFWYPLRNRYMSYQRRNLASIDKEYVLVLNRTSKR